eukprot:scaffold67087_cov79-Phaeocystis_antarctica.AAC.1
MSPALASVSTCSGEAAAAASAPCPTPLVMWDSARAEDDASLMLTLRIAPRSVAAPAGLSWLRPCRG